MWMWGHMFFFFNPSWVDNSTPNDFEKKRLDDSLSTFPRITTITVTGKLEFVIFWFKNLFF
jgi:hypothetical protein